MTAVQIRDLAPDDGPAVRDLILAGLVEQWASVGVTADPSLNPDLDDLAAAYPDGRTVVAVAQPPPTGPTTPGRSDPRSGDVVVGTGTVVPRPGSGAEVVRMSVASARRGGGVGRAVLGELVATARSWGCDHVVLETTTSWTGAIAFYRRCGFRVTEVIDGPFGSETWFRLDL